MPTVTMIVPVVVGLEAETLAVARAAVEAYCAERGVEVPEMTLRPLDAPPTAAQRAALADDYPQLREEIEGA